MRTWFPRRSEYLVGRFQALKLYPSVVAAEFNQAGGEISRDFAVSLTAPQGTIYYTLDGSDPRHEAARSTRKPSPTLSPFN